MDIDQQRAAVLKAMKWAFGTEGHGLSVYDQMQGQGWLSARSLSSDYVAAPDKISDEIFEYIQRRIAQEIDKVGGKQNMPEAQRAIRFIFEHEARLMQPAFGSPVFAIHEDYVELLNLEPVTIIPNTHPRNKGDVPFRRACWNITQGEKEVLSYYFIHSHQEEILEHMVEEDDYYFCIRIFHKEKVAYLTESGQRKLPEAIKEINLPSRGRRSEDDVYLKEAVICTHRGTIRFWQTRKYEILAGLEEEADYYKSGKTWFLTRSGQEKIPEIIKEIKAIPYGRRNEEDITLKEAIMNTGEIPKNLYECRRYEILAGLEEETDYYQAGKIYFLTKSGQEKIPDITEKIKAIPYGHRNEEDISLYDAVVNQNGQTK